MHLGFADAGNDAPTSTTRKAYDLMADGYGPGTNGPLQVVLDTEGEPIPGATLDRVATDLADQAGVASVATPVTNEAGDLAIITVTPTTAPQDSRTDELLEHLREDTIPAAVAGTDVEVSVTGSTALTVGRLVAAAAADAVVPRHRDRAVVPGADDRVPLGARAAEGRVPQRARCRGGLRRHRRGLPVGLGRKPDRRPRDRADHAAGADADVRDPVRALDGLRGVPDEQGPRAVPQALRPEACRGRGRRVRRLG